MKRKLMFAVAVMALFAFTIAAYAYTQASTSVSTSAACCCKGDSCPMKKKDANGKEVSCCDNCDCCKDGKCTGDSCPIKKKDGTHTMDASHHENMSADHTGCSCSCCGKDKETKKDG